MIVEQSIIIVCNSDHVRICRHLFSIRYSQLPCFYVISGGNMEAIFHEKQEGSLCAQHCLNALLQGPYFTPVDLATLAQQMDDEERKRMAESGVDSEDYRKFLEQPSGNMDDSGYFSVQVISSALEVWGLELIPYTSSEPRAFAAQRNPADMQAYICNYKDHWFTVRKLGYQWFNLNSLLTGPELISDTYLAMFLAQLQQEGYSIFVVCGKLPENEADSLLRVAPAVQTVKPRLLADVKASQKKGGASTSTSVEDDDELKVVLKTSLKELEEEEEKEQLERVMKLSMTSKQTKPEEDDEELEKALIMSLEGGSEPTAPGVHEEEDEEELKKALQMSLECCQEESNHIDAEDVRRKRLAYLEKNQKQSNAVPPSSTCETNRDKKVNT